MAPSIPPWSELPHDVLDLVIDRLVSASTDRGFFSRAWSRLLRLLRFSDDGFQAARRARHSVSADRARLRAVCRSWHMAMRRHVPAPRQLPWIVMSDGSFLTPSDIAGTSPSCIPSLPRNARCIASADSWLLLDCTDARKMHSYSLHNPFTNTTVPLPELDGVIGGDVSELFEVRRVLMRTTPWDVIAVMTNNWNHPLILVRPGKGVWLPKPQTAPFIYIIDIAFLGDKLYGITQAEDLVSFGVDFNSNGIPTIAAIERLIRHPPGNYWFAVWSDADDNFNSTSKVKGNMDEVANNGEEHNEEPDKEYHEIHNIEELRKRTGYGMILEGVTAWTDEEVPYEPKDLVTAHWHFVESCGKLLMVKRQIQVPAYSIDFTLEVEVYEANVNEGTHCWVPISGGLGGQAIFISKFFCKSIYTCDEGDQDALHFIDTGEKYNMKSQAMSPTWRDIDFLESMWIFSPELVV